MFYLNSAIDSYWHLHETKVAPIIYLISNDHGCKSLLTIFHFKQVFITLKVEHISVENMTMSGTASLRCALVTKYFLTCGDTLF